MLLYVTTMLLHVHVTAMLLHVHVTTMLLLTPRQHEEVFVAPLYQCCCTVVRQPLVFVVYHNNSTLPVFLGQVKDNWVRLVYL